MSCSPELVECRLIHTVVQSPKGGEIIVLYPVIIMWNGQTWPPECPPWNDAFFSFAFSCLPSSFPSHGSSVFFQSLLLTSHLTNFFLFDFISTILSYSFLQILQVQSSPIGLCARECARPVTRFTSIDERTRQRH